MSETKKSFLDSNLYPVLFMLIVTVIFVGVLSVFYRSTEKKIEIQKQQTYQMQIITLFADTLSLRSGIPKDRLMDLNNLKDNYQQFITEKQIAKPQGIAVNSKYFVATDGKGNELGYCFDVTGSGLWGTMRGLLAVTPDFGRIINFTIYDQMETPGLGARIEEPWFKAQFNGKPLIMHEAVADFVLIPEDAQPAGTQIKQITGATITSSSVLKIIRLSALELSKDFAMKVR